MKYFKEVGAGIVTRLKMRDESSFRIRVLGTAFNLKIYNKGRVGKVSVSEWQEQLALLTINEVFLNPPESAKPGVIWKESPLISSGLMGPVRLISIKKYFRCG